MKLINEYTKTFAQVMSRVEFKPLPECAVVSPEAFPPDALSERELQDAIVEVAEALGCFVYFVRDSRRAHGRGYPDMTILGTRLIQVEAKTSTGYRSEQQKDYATRADAAGVELYLWKPANYFSGEVYSTLWEISPSHFPGNEDIKAMYPVPSDIIHPHDLIPTNEPGVSPMKLRNVNGAVLLDNGPVGSVALSEAEYLHACYLSDENYVGPVWDSLYEDGELELIGWSFPHEDGTLFIPCNDDGSF